VRVLVTAGPTREPIDPVRFLSNRSTGAMGFALARAAQRAGHAPLLVLGPVAGQPPVGVDIHGVETAREMHAAVLDFLPESDAVICAAAVSDYRPASFSKEKIPHGTLRTLELVDNPDISAAVGERRGERPLVVFALETDEGVRRARRKLERKNANLCVLNGPEAIGAEHARFRIVRSDGTVRDLGDCTKDALADAVFEELA